MLGLGVGFHREFSGRENLFLYSALLGRSEKKAREQYDQILEFAELREVIDDPLRTYSVGMTARLGFAVALAEQPEILLVDEVLGVGDIQFREKCLERFREICAQGSTIIMASHNMVEIKENCQRVLWLDHGRVRMHADADAVVQNYIQERSNSKPPKDKA
jgi:ABC-2 type transport system ATP-binding protein/lipopolysaccharide transport system ATP-binding protein